MQYPHKHQLALAKSDVDFTIKGIRLLKIPNRQKLYFLNSFDEVFISCEGVVWMFWGPIQNAGHAINLFKKMGKQVRFLTNNSLRSDEELIAKFRSIGIDNVKPTDIVAPVKTMIRYAKRVMPGKAVFSLCGPMVNTLMIKSGIKVKTIKPVLSLTLENLATFRSSAEDKVGAVLMDVNFNLSISELIRAQQYLEDPECALIVGANNNMIQLTEKLNTIGPGGFVNLLKESSGKDPISLGRGTVLINELMEQFSIRKPNRCLYIGESLETDITFANRCGFQSLLILSSLDGMDDVKKLRPPERPDYILNKMADFVEFMADLA